MGRHQLHCWGAPAQTSSYSDRARSVPDLGLGTLAGKYLFVSTGPGYVVCETGCSSSWVTVNSRLPPGIVKLTNPLFLGRCSQVGITTAGFDSARAANERVCTEIWRWQRPRSLHRHRDHLLLAPVRPAPRHQEGGCSRLDGQASTVGVV